MAKTKPTTPLTRNGRAASNGNIACVPFAAAAAVAAAAVVPVPSTRLKTANRRVGERI